MNSFYIHPGRIFTLKNGIPGKGPVIYWMSRDQRAANNWALVEAARQAQEQKRPLACVFTLVPDFPIAEFRHYAFMLKGLRETETDLKKHGIPMIILTGNPPEVLSNFSRRINAFSIVCDFDPLRIKRLWKDDLLSRVACPVLEVDAHNIVPCRIASQKQETGARTLRPKIARLMDEYLESFPPLPQFDISAFPYTPPDFDALLNDLHCSRSVGETASFAPGSCAALRVLNTFIEERITSYNEHANDPNAHAISDLSPYLHFGQISAQKIVLDIMKKCAPSESRKAFIEQIVIRRELSDNYCFYNHDYDTFDGFPDWAKRSHDLHRNDPRDYLYSTDTFENASTHDRLWNAAQKEMITTGKMHNYMRMYWAKKILEWSASPEEAMRTAVYLNDKYSLDGRDPNGYTGCAWSIGGVHDRAWFERGVFGKIRYMNENGCRRKFDVEKYIRQFS